MMHQEMPEWTRKTLEAGAAKGQASALEVVIQEKFGSLPSSNVPARTRALAIALLAPGVRSRPR